jgi:hypothetical protein
MPDIPHLMQAMVAETRGEKMMAGQTHLMNEIAGGKKRAD